MPPLARCRSGCKILWVSPARWRSNRFPTLLDEPSAGLNRSEREDLARLILRIKDELGLAMIWIEHDMQMVADLADRLHVLDYGRTLGVGDRRGGGLEQFGGDRRLYRHAECQLIIAASVRAVTRSSRGCRASSRRSCRRPLAGERRHQGAAQAPAAVSRRIPRSVNASFPPTARMLILPSASPPRRRHYTLFRVPASAWPPRRRRP